MRRIWHEVAEAFNSTWLVMWGSLLCAHARRNFADLFVRARHGKLGLSYR